MLSLITVRKLVNNLFKNYFIWLVGFVYLFLSTSFNLKYI